MLSALKIGGATRVIVKRKCGFDKLKTKPLVLSQAIYRASWTYFFFIKKEKRDDDGTAFRPIYHLRKTVLYRY